MHSKEQIMDKEAAKEAREQAQEILRRAVGNYGQSVAGDLKTFADFGKGEASMVDVAKAGAAIAGQTSKSFVESSLAMSQAYYKWLLSFSGTMRTSSSKAPTSPSSPNEDTK